MRAHNKHLPITPLTLTYVNLKAGISMEVSVQVRVVLPVLVHVVTHSYLAHLPYL